MLLRVLAGLTLILTGADHWTTYLCLRNPVQGWEVIEANPIADSLFNSVGLIPGLAVDSVITILAIAFLLVSQRFSLTAKTGFLVVIALSTGYAVINNLNAISQMGLSPFSGAA